MKQQARTAQEQPLQDYTWNLLAAQLGAAQHAGEKEVQTGLHILYRCIYTDRYMHVYIHLHMHIHMYTYICTLYKDWQISQGMSPVLLAALEFGHVILAVEAHGLARLLPARSSKTIVTPTNTDFKTV